MKLAIANNMHNLKQKLLPQLFIIYTRYLLGATFVFASLIKIKGKRFAGTGGELSPIDSAAHLFETLYQSGLYWRFIGIAQLCAGFLLMTQRYSKLGAIINLPIILNVFVITLSYEFGLTPIVTGSMLLANFVLILWDWNELKLLFNLTPKFNLANRFEKHTIWQTTGLIMFTFTFVYRLLIDQYNGLFWAAGILLIGISGLIFGLYLKRYELKDFESIDIE